MNKGNAWPKSRPLLPQKQPKKASATNPQAAPAASRIPGRANGSVSREAVLSFEVATASSLLWRMLPIGQQLWLEELDLCQKYPPLQAPETYNLTGILEQVKKAHANHPSD